MSNYIKIEFKNISRGDAEILIAELSEINFDAFEENNNSLSAFSKEENFDEEILNRIITAKNISFTKTTIPETNWNEKWESEFEPIIIKNFVAVRAAFHTPITHVKHEIIITPKMSFGTGHHATTCLMLQQMESIDFTGKTVLDFGTGTGILAIMAKRSGAQKVVAIDNDEWSINNAKENFSANNCTGIVLLLQDDLTGLEQFDIILANINLNVIVNSTQQFSTITHPSSQLLLSGFLNTDEQTIINNFTREGYRQIATATKNEWVSMLLTKS